jgi:preprotein translocase subunit YajC
LILMLIALFYFLVMRPQSREQARRKAMLAAIKKNDRVVTAGGIYGIVTNIRPEADEVTVKVDEATNTKLRMTLGSVSRVVGEEPSDSSGNN